MSADWAQISKQLTINANILRKPISAAFELTSRCNLKCKMCYIASPEENLEKKSKELDADQWIKLAQMARDAGALYIILTGGEVFLRKDFRKIYEAIASMGFVTQIYTNATLITPEIAEWLGKTPPFRVSITVYGASADTYEKVCGVRSGYEKVLNGIKLLHEQGIFMEIKTTAIKSNWRELEAIGAIARENNSRYGIVNYISPRREGCGSDPDEVRLTPAEIVEHDAIRGEYNRKYADPSIIANSDFDESVITKIAEPADVRENAFTCQAGKSSFWLTWDGRMTPCGLMGEPYVLPLELGIDQAWEDLKKLCDAVPVCYECIDCEFANDCFKCPARRKLETGSFDKTAPYLCDIARLRHENRIKNGY